MFSHEAKSLLKVGRAVVVCDICGFQYGLSSRGLYDEVFIEHAFYRTKTCMKCGSDKHHFSGSWE